MSERVPLPLGLFIPRGDQADLVAVEDEIFLDLRDGTGTQFLAGTCYGMAVRDCLRIGRDAYVLKLRPDMRGLLLSELQAHYRSDRVWRLGGEPKGRVLLTDKVFVRFTSGSGQDQRRAALHAFLPDLEAGIAIEDGVYLLTGKFSMDPIFVAKALELDSAVVRSSPVVMTLPSPPEEVASIDLMTGDAG